MLKKWFSVSFAVLLLSFRMAAAAPGQPSLVFAAVTRERYSLKDHNFHGGTLQVFGLKTQPQTIIKSPEVAVKSIQWSPDGRTLVFIEQDEKNHVNTLMAADPNTGESYQLVNTPVYDAISFTPDGKVLYRAEDIFYTIEPKRNAQPEVMTTVKSCTGGGGGGGDFILAYEYYQRETGYNGQTSLLTVTPSGLLTTFPCNFPAHYNLYDSQTGGLIATFPATFRSMALSPDRTYLAAVNIHSVLKQPDTIVEKQLDLVNLADPFAPYTVYTEGYPDQVAWGSDKRHLYYSITLALPLRSSPDTSNISPIINELDLSIGSEKLLYQNDAAFAVARMQARGDWLVFSVVSDQLDSDHLTQAQLDAVPPLSVYALSLISGEIHLLAEDAARFALRP